jgi:hypothetical protein
MLGEATRSNQTAVSSGAQLRFDCGPSTGTDVTAAMSESGQVRKSRRGHANVRCRR